MVVVAGAFGFPRKQVGLSHSRPDITSNLLAAVKLHFPVHYSHLAKQS